MEMERINENTIRVLIENTDLAERGITFLDLLGNHKQIESFFYSILEEVDVEEQFQETDAITFQVLPNRDGLELFISKNMAVNDSVDFAELTDGMDEEGFTDFVKKQMVNSKLLEEEDESLDEVEDYLAAASTTITEAVLKLDSFEDMVQLAKEVSLQNAVTSLYEMKGQYFLQISFFTEELSDEQIDNDISQVLEFANITSITPEVLVEYGELIMERTALELTRYYFK